MEDKIRKTLQEQGVSLRLLEQIERFARRFPADEEGRRRMRPPLIPFFGKEIFEMAAIALLEGENLLLAGTKATGKNVLAENLAWVFGRPVYNVSFHINTDSSTLIGTDTFRNNEVVLRTGPIYESAVHGAFAVLDEINMAKNEAVSVLHACLDYRRVIDIPGYEKIHLHDAARFIGTMNYGYAGTRELNEALVSRFMVIDMPEVDTETLERILMHLFPEIRKEGMKQVTGFFADLQIKAAIHEISSRPLALRGLVGALRTVRGGLSPYAALKMGIVNKTSDLYEREVTEDVLMTRIPPEWGSEELFA